MNVKIYTCVTKPTQCPIHTEFFQSLVSGEMATDGCISDLEGVNIAECNEFSELRHQYYVWKNLLGTLDYVGFEHYRRVFFIDYLPANAPLMRQSGLDRVRHALLSSHQRVFPATTAIFSSYCDLRRGLDDLDVKRIRSWVCSYDIIAVRPDNDDIETTWNRCHDVLHWSHIIAATKSTFVENYGECFIHLGSARSYYFNMFVMRADLFDEYMTFIFSDCSKLKKEVIVTHRLFGYIAERVFTLWLLHKRFQNPLLRIGELPILFANDLK